MTTGRINQVAILHDAARRPRSVGTFTGRARPSYRERSIFAGTGKGIRPTSTACTGSESIARPHGPHDRRWIGGTQGALHCPPPPFHRAPDGGLILWDRFPMKGRQHENHRGTSVRPDRDLATIEQGATVDSSMNQHRASRRRQPKHHSHARTFTQTDATYQPHPASPWVKRADGRHVRRQPDTARHENPTRFPTTLTRRRPPRLNKGHACEVKWDGWGQAPQRKPTTMPHDPPESNNPTTPKLFICIRGQIAENGGMSSEIVARSHAHEFPMRPGKGVQVPHMSESPT